MKKLSTPVKLWLKALRSGKYKRDEGQLKTDKGYCCLGVACEVAIQQGVIKRYNGTNGILPRKVKQWLGLSSVAGEFGNHNALTILNDSGTSFKKIAAIIEKQPEGLFQSGK